MSDTKCEVARMTPLGCSNSAVWWPNQLIFLDFCRIEVKIKFGEQKFWQLMSAVVSWFEARQLTKWGDTFCSQNLIFTSILQETRKISWFGPKTAELELSMGVNLATSHFILKGQTLMHEMHQLPRFGGIWSADASAAAVFGFFSFWLSVQRSRNLFGPIFCKVVLHLVFYLEPKYEHFLMDGFREIAMFWNIKNTLYRRGS